MSVVRMNRFSLLAFEEDREVLLQNLQKFKYVHFLNLKDNEKYEELGLEAAKIPENLVEIDREISMITYGIETLAPFDKRPTGLKAMKEGKESLEFSQLEERALGIDYKLIYEKLKEVNDLLESLKGQKEQYYTNLQEIVGWDNLDLPIGKLDSIEKCKVFMGTIPKRKQVSLERALLETEYTYLEVVGEYKANFNVFIITIDDEVELLDSILRANEFSQVELNIEKSPAEEIKDIQSEIRSIEKKQEDSYKVLEEMGNDIPKLELVYDYLQNKRLRYSSLENFLKVGEVGVIQGYIPKDTVDDFNELVGESLNNEYYLELEEARDDDEEVPILLENSDRIKPFESLTHMYSLPKYNEIDPTPFLAFFHMLFIGMMIADFGYGLLLFVGTFIGVKFFNLSEEQKNSLMFFLYAGLATMFWGVIFGSFFGGIVPMPFPALLDPMTQYNTVLLLSIALGVIHIFYALGIQGYIHLKNGKPWEALFDTGFWYMALGGAIVLLLAYLEVLPKGSMNPAKWVMIIGMVGIVLTGGRDSPSVGGKLGQGVYSLYGITGYIGDFVSYSRLMALGLSGGYIAYAINLIVGMLVGTNPLGALGGIALFVGGHLLNVFLSTLSGYVHTIRLTFVEFFGKFYEGGGVPFEKFISKSKYINIK